MSRRRRFDQNPPAAMRDMRRMMRPSGLLILAIVYSFADRGLLASTDAGAPFVVEAEHFGEQSFMVWKNRPLGRDFVVWSRPYIGLHDRRVRCGAARSNPYLARVMSVFGKSSPLNSNAAWFDFAHA